MSMYHIYEIDERIKSLVDDETGEIHEFDLLLELNLERDYLIEHAALAVKNLEATVGALKAEIKHLTDKRDAAQKQADKLREGLLRYLGGDKLVTPLVTVSTRKSTVVEIDDTELFVAWAEVNANALLKFAAPEIRKADVKEALKNGAEMPFASLTDKRNLQIK